MTRDCQTASKEAAVGVVEYRPLREAIADKEWALKELKKSFTRGRINKVFTTGDRTHWEYLDSEDALKYEIAALEAQFKEAK